MRTLDEQIVYVKSKIGDLAAKEGKYKNRRTKLEQRLKTLLKHRQARLDSLHLAALQVRIDNDPAELARLAASPPLPRRAPRPPANLRRWPR